MEVEEEQEQRHREQVEVEEQLELQHELNPQTFEGTSARSSGAAVVRAVGRGEDEATTP